MEEDISSRYLSWIADEAVMRFTPQGPRRISYEEAKEYVRQNMESADAFLWKIELPGGEHVGNIRVSNVSKADKSADIAIIIGERQHRSQGFGPKVIETCVKFLNCEFGLTRVYAHVFNENRASLRAFSKAGFRVLKKTSDIDAENDSADIALLVHQFALDAD